MRIKGGAADQRKPEGEKVATEDVCLGCLIAGHKPRIRAAQALQELRDRVASTQRMNQRSQRRSRGGFDETPLGGVDLESTSLEELEAQRQRWLQEK